MYFKLFAIILFAYHSCALEEIEKRLKQTNMTANDRNDIMKLVREKFNSSQNIGTRKAECALHAAKVAIKETKKSLVQEMNLKKEKFIEELKSEKKRYEEKIKQKKEELKTVKADEKRRFVRRFEKKMASAKEKFRKLANETEKSFGPYLTELIEKFENLVYKNHYDVMDLIESEQVKLDEITDMMENDIVNKELVEFEERVVGEEEKFGDKIYKLKESLEQKMTV